MPLLLIAVLGIVGVVYLTWSPGINVRDGRHDLRTNAIWIGHGWLGDDLWFERYRKDTTRFRDEQRIVDLADRLAAQGIRYVYPHPCPCDSRGGIAPVDAAQTQRFLDHIGEVVVVPWIGGVLDVHCFPQSPQWRQRFVSSAVELLEAHSRLAGVQVNIEPIPTGNEGFLALLDELRAVMPEGKILSVAAYPPTTRWHPVPDVHWDESYYKAVACRADQFAPMMYGTAIRLPKFYRHLMCGWTTQILDVVSPIWNLRLSL
jgi:hypothetical protein